MRIATITPYLPAPANTGGRIRMFRLGRALAEHAELWLYACAGDREATALRNHEELGIYRRVSTRNNGLSAAPLVASPHRVRHHCPARLARDLRRDHARAPFDAVVVAHSYAAALAHAVPALPLVVDEHNVESEYHAQYIQALAGRELRAQRREVARLAAWERRVWTEATAVTCVTEADARTVAAHRGGPAHVVPNGAPVGDVPFVLPSERRGREVLFVGLMSHAPNVAAARFLAREVMPRVWRDEPGARLVLCGRAPVREVWALAGPGIVVTGTVPSVTPYLTRAAVYANALLQGAGSSLKVPEALASGVPLVSTTVGVRGFRLQPGEHFASADDADAFARAILRVLRDRAAFDTQARAGRAVAAGLDWDSVAARFAQIVLAAARGALA